MFFLRALKTPFHKLQPSEWFHFMLLLCKTRNFSLGPPLLFCTVFLSYFSVPPFSFPALLGLWDLSSLAQGLNQAMSAEC